MTEYIEKTGSAHGEYRHPLHRQSLERPQVEGCRTNYRDELARRYGWPLKIHARGYDAYLVGAQPLLEGGPTPIYRFPGGNSLVDECEMLPASAENAARRILGCEGKGGCNA